MNNFLNNHPRLEVEFGLDKDHVIVDKEDWLSIKRYLAMNTSILQEIKDFDEYFLEEWYVINKELEQNHKPGL